MDREHWVQLEDLFHAAAELPSSDRDAFVADHCGSNSELRRALQSLLDAQGPGPLDTAEVQDWNFERLCNTLTQSAALESTELFLQPGTSVGPYKIEGNLGKGGMGIVYRARDTRLGRLVAVKFLSGPIVTDRTGLERFRREAQAISTLNHPNVCTVYDIGEQDGRPYLVMELMEGQTLKERIAAAPFSNDQLLSMMIPILDALDAAHAVGIIHRDIKPANIFICRQGPVKILDFGLAKSTARGDASHTLTAPGATMGTISYMSPEQVRGTNVDARSDLFACGVVLYLMATRTLPFSGEGWTGTLEAVLNHTPRPPRELTRDLSPEIERVIDRALEKDPEARYQSAADMRADLLRAKRLLEAKSAPPPAAKFPYAMLGALALLLIAGAVWYFGRSRPVTSPSEYVQLTDFSDSATAPAISSDGRMVAFFRGGSWFLTPAQIYVKPLPSGESTLLTDDANAKYGLAFTPDGSRVAYSAITRPADTWNTWTVPTTGGAPSLLMRNAVGLSWIGNGELLFSEVMPGSQLHMGVVTALESRANERRIYFPDHERAMAHYSFISPDHKSALAVEMDGSAAWQRCRLLPMDGNSPTRQIGPEGACIAAAWSPDGKWMYLNSSVNGQSHLWRQKFPDGVPEQITHGPSEEQGLAIVPDGQSLIASVGIRKISVWMHDASGERPLSAEGSASSPRFSADYKRVYYLLRKTGSSTTELWFADRATGRSNPSLAGVSMVDFDISSDGQQVAFTGSQKQIFLAPLDGSAPPRQIFTGGDMVSFGAPGELVFRQLGPRASYLARIKTDGQGFERILDETILDKNGVSPDGAWAVASHSSTFAVSLKTKIHKPICRGGCISNWSRDGAWLYVTTQFDPTISAGTTLVFPIPHGMGAPDLSAAGIDTNSDAPPGIRVIRQAGVAPGPDPDTYAFAKSDFVGNLFRIPLH